MAFSLSLSLAFCASFEPGCLAFSALLFITTTSLSHVGIACLCLFCYFRGYYVYKLYLRSFLFLLVSSADAGGVRGSFEFGTLPYLKDTIALGSPMPTAKDFGLR
jgi:hypothetical protein